MTRTRVLALSLLGLGILCLGTARGAPQEAVDPGWPKWRGPHGTGYVDGSRPPTTWSETENIRWKTPLPGQGHSS
ncbi:MAG TPA: hypothetical protein PKE00_02295, partial [Planctomycetota bacterium]|nr:hypothetical protein [Planctomycetota bacterium]